MPIWATLKALSESLRCQPVTEVLLIEAGLAATGSIPFLRPVARGIGGKRLVNEDKLAIDEPKLELRVCDNESSRGCILRCGGVKIYGDDGDLIVQILPDERGGCGSEVSSR